MIESIVNIIFGDGKIPNTQGVKGTLEFSMACACFSLLFIVLDFCIVYMRNKSFLQLQYKLNNRFLLCLVFPLASSIVGLLGFCLDVLQTTRSASIAVGLGWPFIMGALFNTPDAIGGEDDPAPGGEVL